jgi:hypothetical protein
MDLARAEDARNTEKESARCFNKVSCSDRMESRYAVGGSSEGSAMIRAVTLSYPRQQCLIALKSFSLPQSLARKWHAPAL